MTLIAAAVRPTLQTTREPIPWAPEKASPANDYERVLHQLVRREFAVLADLASWAPAEDSRRATQLTRHAGLVIRLLIQHHATEGDALWPALVRSLPAEEQEAARAAVADWTGRTAALDRLLSAQGTAARQWTLTLAAPARDAFRRVSAEVAEAVDRHIAIEEERLLPLLAPYLPGQDWATIRHAAHSPLKCGQRRLVLGLALEDACVGDRTRLLAALPVQRRTAWLLFGRRRYRAAIVRLRGAPPAA